MAMAMPPVVVIPVIPVVIIIIPEFVTDIFAMFLPVVPSILPIGRELVGPLGATILAPLYAFPIGSGTLTVSQALGAGPRGGKL